MGMGFAEGFRVRVGSEVSSKTEEGLFREIGTSKWWAIASDLHSWSSRDPRIKETVSFHLAHRTVGGFDDPSYEFGVIYVGGGFGLVDWVVTEFGFCKSLKVLLVLTSEVVNKNYLKPAIIKRFMGDELAKEERNLTMKREEYTRLVTMVREGRAPEWWMVGLNLQRSAVKSQVAVVKRIKQMIGYCTYLSPT